jgi:hypothetical protein
VIVDDLLRRVRAAGANIILRGNDVAVVNAKRLDDETVRTLRAHVQDLRNAALLERYPFTSGGKLCCRCRGLGRVAVISGDLVCEYCVVAEAQRIASKGSGT